MAFADRAIELAAVGVATDPDIKRSESRLLWVVHFTCQQDGSGTSSKCWFGTSELFQPLETGHAQQFEKCAGLAPGDHQAVDFVQLFGLLDQHNLSTQLFKPFTGAGRTLPPTHTH